jgi:hypothetical protein
VVTKELAPSYVAAMRCGGLALDFEVVATERRLREALLRDGLEPKAGYRWVQDCWLGDVDAATAMGAMLVADVSLHHA